ncbi:hypothetical protein LTR70_006333 [Exophiala xenobiotica]|uniref:Uncharacterized protein n=1 Tax=Lithohypha guttulata TaxID=1690604 RepID=A0ABR0K7Z7_9EURO|nr:hypothetical protein LTR24_005802 [Lithohypha guttulata]KAK5316278.1 hypothetical protein LTR70_006333 [Exophiala xenobiotica]
MASSSPASDASHESGDDGANGSNTKPTAVKDKECPYCHQKFTSSSLGRHLDQFINKKKPDGVHDVEGIKKMRAGITRRTVRGGRRDVERSEERSGHASPNHSSNQVPTPAFLESLNKSEPGTNDVRFNRMGWQSTGVITDPVNHVASARAVSPMLSGGVNNATAGSKRTFSTYAADLPGASANETNKALELSLREVLDAVSVATKKAAPLPEPFPFDLTSQTFPGLCLLLLPPPATLFQPSPFATSTTIPLQPPGMEQLHALRQKIRFALDQWKWDALAHVQRHPSQNNTTVGEEAERLTRTAQERIEDAMRHLETAFHYFMSNGPEQQYQLWSIELLRAYKREQDRLKEATERIARITQEASQLQQQIDYLSRCQWPREMALWPPERNMFGSAVQKELLDNKPAATSLDTINAYGTTKDPGKASFSPEWDFDKLVNKWKRHVREDRARRGGAGASMLPPLSEGLERTGTPPSAGVRAPPVHDALRNGDKPTSAADSPIIRNGIHPSGSLSIADKPATFVHHSGMQRSFAGTAHVHPHHTRAGNNGPSRTRMRASNEQQFLYANDGANADRNALGDQLQEQGEIDRPDEIEGQNGSWMSGNYHMRL